MIWIILFGIVFCYGLCVFCYQLGMHEQWMIDQKRDEHRKDKG